MSNKKRKEITQDEQDEQNTIEDKKNRKHKIVKQLEKVENDIKELHRLLDKAIENTTAGENGLYNRMKCSLFFLDDTITIRNEENEKFTLSDHWKNMEE